MRILTAILALSPMFASFASSAEKTELPPIPTTLVYANGTTLRNVSVIRFERDRVIVKHAGGADPVRYDLLSPPMRTVMLKHRDIALSSGGKSATQAATTTLPTVSGQIFVTTRGAQNIKLGGVVVYAFPSEVASAFETYQSEVNLPAPLAKTQSDADGNFSIVIPGATNYFLFAQASRLVGENRENYQWRITTAQVTDKTKLLLTNSNMAERNVAVKIAK